jgi:protein-serine/threonine kinase
LVRHNSNAKLYALKQIKKEYFREFKSLEGVLREKKIMVEITHDLPFTVKLEAAFESYRHLNFLLEFYPGGEMFFHLTFKKLSEEESKICFAQILVTM